MRMVVKVRDVLSLQYPGCNGCHLLSKKGPILIMTAVFRHDNLSKQFVLVDFEHLTACQPRDNVVSSVFLRIIQHFMKAERESFGQWRLGSHCRFDLASS